MKQISGKVITTREWEFDHAFVVEALLAYIAREHKVSLRGDPSDFVALREGRDINGYGDDEGVFNGKFILQIESKNKC
jgi:hypothetical protein